MANTARSTVCAQIDPITSDADRELNQIKSVKSTFNQADTSDTSTTHTHTHTSIYS